MRRMAAADESTVCARASSSERTRTATGSGDRRHPHDAPVQTDHGPHRPRSGEQEQDAGEEDAEPVHEPELPAREEVVPEEDARESENRDAGPLHLPITGR